MLYGLWIARLLKVMGSPLCTRVPAVSLIYQSQSKLPPFDSHITSRASVTEADCSNFTTAFPANVFVVEIDPDIQISVLI